MEYKIFKKEVNHTFKISIDETNGLKVKVDGQSAYYEKGVLKFLRRIKGVNGIKITDDIKEKIEAIEARIIEKNEQEKREREQDRPAPAIDESKYLMFWYGCDTQLIYPQENREAIENILEDGLVKATPVFKGSRDDSRKFPEQYDSLIPSSYVKDVGDFKYTAEGYKNVWFEDQYILPREVVERAQNEILEAKRLKREENETREARRIQAMHDEAVRTGKNQIINQYSDDCDDSNEECDIDNITEYITPAGKRVVERSHTW